MLDELADFLGLRAHVAEITRRAMNGEIDFAAALAERVALLRGLPAAVLDEAAARIRLMPGARALIATAARAPGARPRWSPAGSPSSPSRSRERLGFDRVVCQPSRARRRPASPGRSRRRSSPARPSATRCSRSPRSCGVALGQTLAVGDGANDLPMLQTAGLGIAFHAKPVVAAAARWRIDHADLTALLYAQGYRRGRDRWT